MIKNQLLKIIHSKYNDLMIAYYAFHRVNCYELEIN